MGMFNDMIKNATGKMSGESTVEKKKIPTVVKLAENICIGEKFLDSDGITIYEVTDKKIRGLVTALYAVTESNEPDGWFQRDSYNVIVEGALQTNTDEHVGSVVEGPKDTIIKDIEDLIKGYEKEKSKLSAEVNKSGPDVYHTRSIKEIGQELYDYDKFINDLTKIVNKHKN